MNLTPNKTVAETAVGAGRAAGAGVKPRGVTPLCAVPAVSRRRLYILR